MRVRGTLAITLAAVLAASACGGGSESAGGNAKLTIGTFASSPINVIERVAQEQGMFDEQGLEASFLEIPSGPDLASALIGGTADYSTGMVPVVAGAVANGECMTYLGAGQRSMYDVIASVDWDVSDSDDLMERLASLKGAKIGVPAIGGVVQVAMSRLLADAGLTDTDVTYIATGGFATALPAFERKQVDALLAFPPIEQSLGADNFKLVANLRDDSAENPWRDLVQGGPAVTCAYAEKNPEQVESYCSALWDSWDFVTDPANREAVGTSLAAVLKVDQADGETIWKDYSQTFPGLEFDQELWDAQQKYLPEGVTMPDYDKHVYQPCAGGDPR